MIDKDKEYWFALETYVYTMFKNEQVLLYNTLDGEHVLSNNKYVVPLIEQLFTESNGGVIMLDKEELQNQDIYSFILDVREKFMGDVYDVTLFKSKPIQLYPILNFSRDVKKLKNIKSRSIGEQALNHLHVMNINLDSPDTKDILSFENLKSLLWQVQFANIQHLNIFMHNRTTLPEMDNIKQLFNDYPIKSNWHILIQNIDNSICLSLPQNSLLTVIIDNPVPENLFKTVVETIPPQMRDKSKFIFKIYNTEQYFEAEQLIIKYKLQKHSIQPGYNKKNLNFIRSEVFMTKDEIFEDKLSLKEIFANQTINTNDFGKLTILPNGDIYANTKFPKLGNIATNSIYEVIYKELDEGTSWLRIRDQKPCSDCIYQWICPAPSDLELSIGKPNLCHVQPNLHICL